MFELIVLYLSAFIIGLSRGSLICATLCAPTLVPYLSSKGLTPMEGMSKAILFNLPRVLILTLAGGIIGFLSFGVVNQPSFLSIVGGIKTAGYFVMGLLIFLFGALLFLRSGKPEYSGKDACAHCIGCAGAAGKKKQQETAEKTGGREGDSKKETLFILSWGSLLGLVCLSEITLLEGGVIASMGGILGSSAISSVFIGASAMFVFGLGASIPIIVVSVAGVKYAERFSDPEKLRELRKIGGVIMLMLGLALMLRELKNLIGLF